MRLLKLLHFIQVKLVYYATNPLVQYRKNSRRAESGMIDIVSFTLQKYRQNFYRLNFNLKFINKQLSVVSTFNAYIT